MAITFCLPVGTEGTAGAVLVDDAVVSINLRASPYSSATYNGSFVDHGVYQFTNVASGEYKVYSNTTELTIFGIIKVGEHTAVLITGTQTVAGTKTFSNQMILSSGLKTDTISENTLNAGVTIDSILIKDNLNTSGIMALTGAQTATGLKTFSDDIKTDFIYEETAASGVNIDGVVLKDSGLDIVQLNDNFSCAGWYITGAPIPVVGSGVANKAYVDTRTRNNTRVVYVDPGLSADVDGQAYADILDAVTYCVNQTPAANNQFTVIVEGMYNQPFVTASAGSIQDYVHIRGAGKHINIVFSDDSLTLTNGTSISNCTAYFGANDITTDRAFVKLNFYDVNIYHYLDLTLNGCQLMNCWVIGSSTKLLNYGGTTILQNIAVRNTANELGGFTGANFGIYVWGDFVVPTDPSEAS